MSSIFDLKKQPERSPFDKATIIVEKDRGKNKQKRIILDYNLCKALGGLDSQLKLGFIIERMTYMVNLTGVDLDIPEKDIFKTSKTFNLIREAGGNKYYFKSINNSRLWDAFSQNWELDNTKTHKSNVYLIPMEDVEEKVFQELTELGIKEVYILDGFSSFETNVTEKTFLNKPIYSVVMEEEGELELDVKDTESELYLYNVDEIGGKVTKLKTVSPLDDYKKYLKEQVPTIK